jgi:hypothetical protein
MTKLGTRLLISDETLRAIGHVAAQWAFLEIEFDLFLGQLLRHPDARNIAPARMPQSFDRRASLFRHCAKTLLAGQPKLRDQLISIINDACSIRGHRDNVIHGQWHLGRKKRQLGSAVTIIKQRPKFSAHLRHMSAEQIEEVAAKISIATARLIWWREMNVSYGSQEP